MDRQTNEVLNCVQINLQRSKNSTARLNKYIIDNKIDIVFIQEPYVIKNKVCGFPLNYRIFHTISGDKPKSAIVFTNYQIQVIHLQTYSKDFITICNTELYNKKMCLISAYCSPHNHLNQELSLIQSAIDSINVNNLVICMDSNSHSTEWYDHKNDLRGSTVCDFISSNNMIILNNNENSPTFDNIRGKSSIDITISSHSLVNKINGWFVDEEESLSDHKYIRFKINESFGKVEFKSTLKYVTKKANWSAIRDELRPLIIQTKHQIINSIEKSQINIIIEKLTKNIINTCDKNIPIKRQTIHKKSNKWWTQELTSMRRTVNRLRRQYQRCQTSNRERLKSIFETNRQKYKDLMNDSKIKRWNEFVVENTRENPWGLIYKIAKNNIKLEKNNEIITPNGDLITDGKEIAETLFDSFFPNDESIPETEYHSIIRQNLMEIKNNRQLDSNQNEYDFTEEEVSAVIESQNPRKAPGSDGLTADIISYIHNIDRSLFTLMFNKLLELTVFPKIWKQSIVKVIPKPSKSDYRQPNSYRPISLLPVLAKIFEKLIIDRIVYHLRHNNLINKSQYGFTPQVSTETALHSMVDFIKNVFNKKGFCLVISLDISGAFNYCWWPKILHQLRLKKCPKNLFDLIESYFEDRSANLWYLNTETKRDLNIGCPQGSASGPWLWNIAYDDIFDLSEDNIKIIGFADDTLIMIESQNIQDLEIKANNKLQQISEWGRNNKLTFNVDKTACILFTKRLKYNSPKIKFEEKELNLVKRFKYLGLIIDNKLSWRSHAQYIQSKVSTFINRLLIYAKNNYGLDSKAIEVIYKGAVLPMISYGCSVWAEAINRKFFINPLITIQRRVGLRIIKAYRTVSIDATNILSNTQPIDLYLKGRAAEYYIKHKIVNNISQYYLEKMGVDLDCIQRPIDVRILKSKPFRKKIIFSENSSQTNLEALFDGAKFNGQTGGAFIIYNKLFEKIIVNKKVKLGDNCTIFQSSLLALEKLLEFVLKSESIYQIEIYIKSKSISMAISDPNSTNQLIHNIYKKYYKCLTENKCIKFLNIDRSTANSRLNIIEELAKQAAQSHNRISFDLIPMSYIKSSIFKQNILNWNERWQTTEKAAITHQYFPDVETRMKIKRHFKTDYYLTQALTGHGAVNAYLFKFKRSETENCHFCGEQKEDVNHRLFICPHFDERRQRLIEFVENKGEAWPIENKELLNKEYFREFLNLISYTFNTN